MIQPYIKEDSCCLPYVIKRDEFGFDVIIFNNKKIPLNKKNSSVNYQISIYNNCIDDYEYKSFEIIDNIYVFIKYINYPNKIVGNFNIIDNGNIINLNTFINDDKNVYSLSCNDKYIVMIKSDLEYIDKQIIEAYDIDNKKMIDCNNYNNIELLMKYVVNKKRCSKEILEKILNNNIDIDDYLVYDFLSYLNDKKIDNNNYKDYIDVSCKYILNCYPNIYNKDLEIYTFNTINHTINNLTYIENKKKIRI